MEFDLKKYITERYLTEKLQSDTLVHELMNDKGKMFTYYKLPYEGTLYKKSLDYAKELKEITDSVFNWGNELKKEIHYKDKIYTTDKEVKALYKKYMSIYNKYIDTTSKIFMKPDPQLLSSISQPIVAGNAFSGRFSLIRTDLFNITDENFYKATFSEIKNDKSLKLKITNDVLNRVVFWFSADNEILVVSLESIMVLYSVNNNNISYEAGRRWENNITEDQIINAVRKENLTVNNIKTVLADGTELIWPTVQQNSYLGDRHDLCGILFVEKYLDISKGTAKHFKPFTVGSFMSKASKLYKLTKWGENPNDFVIVYTPEPVYKDEKGEVISSWHNAKGSHKFIDSPTLGYNDYKAGSMFSKVKQDRKADFIEISKNTYKWVKDIFDKYEPYANGKASEYFEFGRKLSEEDYEFLYGNDYHCSKLAAANISRYKNLIERNKSLIGISNFNEQLKPILADFNRFTKAGQALCDEIKSLFSKDYNKFREAIMLYGVYNKLLNSSLSFYGNIQLKIDEIKKKAKKLSTKYSLENEQIYKDLISLKTVINNYIQKIAAIQKEISETYEKINDLLD